MIYTKQDELTIIELESNLENILLEKLKSILITHPPRVVIII